METNFDNPVKVDLSKLIKVWNPFKRIIWVNVQTPITPEEIQEAINANTLISPTDSSARKKRNEFFDMSSREEHVQRIAWLVVNYSEDYPISIEVGIPSMNVGFAFYDGNHRLCAAIFLKKKYIMAELGGEFGEMEKLIYRK